VPALDTTMVAAHAIGSGSSIEAWIRHDVGAPLSIPVGGDDPVAAEGDPGPVGRRAMEVADSREALVGGNRVRRALPQRTRRTIGAWCFADHMGPTAADGSNPLGVGPHPHMGLHTVTWLLAGELLHRDSLGSEQVIRPGQLNLMTAANGVSHAEEPTAEHRGSLHGIQLWVALPEATRHGVAAFEHHADLPEVDFPNAVATVLVGSLSGVTSPARADTPMVGVDLDLRPGTTTVALQADFEHGLVVMAGSIAVDGRRLAPGHLGALAPGRAEVSIAVESGARLLLLGGVPFDAPLIMWWNFVGRSRAEMVAATEEWNVGSERFGDPGSSMPRIPAPAPPWREATT
jgi:quercetin 2,3-dioxygenase